MASFIVCRVSGYPVFGAKTVVELSQKQMEDMVESIMDQWFPGMEYSFEENGHPSVQADSQYGAFTACVCTEEGNINLRVIPATTSYDREQLAVLDSDQCVPVTDDSGTVKCYFMASLNGADIPVIVMDELLKAGLDEETASQVWPNTYFELS